MLSGALRHRKDVGERDLPGLVDEQDVDRHRSTSMRPRARTCRRRDSPGRRRAGRRTSSADFARVDPVIVEHLLRSSRAGPVRTSTAFRRSGQRATAARRLPITLWLVPVIPTRLPGLRAGCRSSVRRCRSCPSRAVPGSRVSCRSRARTRRARHRGRSRRRASMGSRTLARARRPPEQQVAGGPVWPVGRRCRVRRPTRRARRARLMRVVRTHGERDDRTRMRCIHVAPYVDRRRRRVERDHRADLPSKGESSGRSCLSAGSYTSPPARSYSWCGKA